MPGSQIDAQLEGSVASMPYNISVLSISHVIIANGIDGNYTPVAAPPPNAPPPAEVPAPAESPEEPADAPVADGPTPSEAPADAPAADAPADAPEADAPTADAPAADNTPVADANAKSGAGKQVASSLSLGFIVALVSFIAA